MEDNQLVSVLISIYKESVPVVSRAIESVRQQTYRNIEIIVMLDYPEHEEMCTYLADLAKYEPRLQYYINEKNIGLLHSLNRGIGLCRGEFICRMDEDDYSEEERIEKQLLYGKAQRLDLVGSYTSLMDMEGKLTGEIRKYPSHHKYLCQYLKYMNAVPHPTWLVRKTVYEKLNAYRDIPCADDYDFLIRVCLGGYRIGVVPEPLLRYRINRRGMTQQNIASQKIVSPYLADQLRKNRIYTEEEIANYRTRHKHEEEKLVRYYTAGKKWKNGERTSFVEKCGVLFNSRTFEEIGQRLACKWIFCRDRRYDNY